MRRGVGRHAWMAVLMAGCLTACGRQEQPAPAQPASPSKPAAKDSAAPPTTIPPAAASAAPEAKVGSPAPDWELKDVDGNPVSLAEFRGKKGVLLVFFATWCPHCMKEVPELIALQNQVKDRPIQIVAAAYDQPLRAIKRFVTERNVNYRVVLDPDGAVATRYGVVGIPMNVVIDRSGTIRYMDNMLPEDRQAMIQQLESVTGPEK